MTITNTAISQDEFDFKKYVHFKMMKDLTVSKEVNEEEITFLIPLHKNFGLYYLDSNPITRESRLILSGMSHTEETKLIYRKQGYYTFITFEDSRIWVELVEISVKKTTKYEKLLLDRGYYERVFKEGND